MKIELDVNVAQITNNLANAIDAMINAVAEMVINQYFLTMQSNPNAFYHQQIGGGYINQAGPQAVLQQTIAIVCSHFPPSGFFASPEMMKKLEEFVISKIQNPKQYSNQMAQDFANRNGGSLFGYTFAPPEQPTKG